MEAHGLPAPLGWRDRLAGQLTWYFSLSAAGRGAFWATFGGWALDAYNQMSIGFGLTAISAQFALSEAQGGLLGSVALVTSAIGGALAGALADQIGRVRVLIISIASYAAFTLLLGLAQSYEQLLVFSTLQELGFGGEWAAGAVLVAEYARPEQRGRVVGAVQSAWAFGYAGVLLVNTIAFSVAPPSVAWRILLCAGALPAVLLLWARTRLQESPVFRHEEAARAAGTAPTSARPGGALVGLFAPRQVRITLASTVLSIGVVGAGFAFWLPTYLQQVRGLSVDIMGVYLGVQVVGGFIGCLLAGYLLDWLGRRSGMALFAVASALSLLAYVAVPADGTLLVLALGFPLGFFSSGIFSCLAVYLAELYPTELRGAGQGFGYNIGRGLSAFGPAAIGVVATQAGLGAGLALAASSYGLCLVALLALPETRGRALA